MDLNQPSRLQTYSQLKMLLALTDSMDPELRQEINGRLEHISLNPFENDLEAEAKVAREQYEGLLQFAKNPDGLAAKIERDRRSELTPLEHGRSAQIALRVMHILSFGKYVHREELTADMQDRLDIARRLNFHTKFLLQVARTSAEVEVAWNLEEIKKSLRFIADHAADAGGPAASAAARIFLRTKDDETRHACLDSLSRIGSPRAKNELLRISQSNDLNQTWRDIAGLYLHRVNQPAQPIAATVDGSPLKTGQPQ